MWKISQSINRAITKYVFHRAKPPDSWPKLLENTMILWSNAQSKFSLPCFESSSQNSSCTDTSSSHGTSKLIPCDTPTLCNFFPTSFHTNLYLVFANQSPTCGSDSLVQYISISIQSHIKSCLFICKQDQQLKTYTEKYGTRNL